MNRYSALSVTTALLAFASLTAAAHAQTATTAPPVTAAPPAVAAPAPEVDPAAMALLKKVQTTMFGLRTYRAECWTTITFDTAADGKPRPRRYNVATLTAAKPNLMRYDSWTMKAENPEAVWTREKQTPTYTFVCDGKTNWRQYGPSYRTDKRTEAKYLSTILEPWGGFYSEESSPYISTTSAQKDGGLLEVRKDGTETVDGVTCDKVFTHLKAKYANTEQEYWTTWYIAPDGLVRRKTEHVTFDGTRGYKRDSVLHKVVINTPVTSRAKLFAYTPPAGVKSEEQIERDRPALLASGKTAPDFSATDVNGKLMKLSDLRGKVVVLDFWASWCPPCIASMPHNQAVTKKLQGEGLPVVLFAVDNGEEREAFSAWVAKHTELDALMFAHVPPKTSDVSGKLFNVTGIPSQYVIDAQGVIRASSVGFGGPTDDIEKSVRAALKAH